jgi:hypothetical protein
VSGVNVSLNSFLDSSEVIKELPTPPVSLPSIHRASTNVGLTSLEVGLMSPSLTNFQITDMLEKSMLVNSREKAEKHLKSILSIFKR